MSIDGKATVHIGEFSRGDMTRGDHQACEHDFGCREQSSPCGVVDEDSGELHITFGSSYNTSDCLVDTLEAKWQAMDAPAQAAVELLQIKRDNGPESSGVRTQFLHRMVQFADHIGKPMPLLYDPPYHSKYHPIERCWGILEVPWNGTKLVDVETMMAWAKSMTWKRLHPGVTLSRKVYQRRIALGKKAMQEVEHRLERHPDLPKGDILIRPVAALYRLLHCNWGKSFEEIALSGNNAWSPIMSRWRMLPVEAPRREIVLPRAVYMAGALLLGGYVVYWLRDALTPLLLAFLIAYLCDPVVDRLEAWHVPRPAAIALVLGGALSLVGLFLVLVLPGLATDVAGVIRELPKQLTALWTTMVPWLEQRGITVPHTTTEWIERLNTPASEVASAVLAPAGSIVSTVIGGTLSVLGSVVAALVVVVLAIYLLNDFDRLTAGVRDLLPGRWRAPVTSYATDIDAILSQFIRGQLIVMGILAVLYSSAYGLLGVRLAVPIGLTAGMLSFIPYLGSAYALAAGVLMSLLGGWHGWQFLGVVLAYTAIQMLEGFVITPRVVGETVGLSAVWVLVALFVGGELFGFLGVLLAVPAAAVAKIFVARAVQYYRTTPLFLQAPPDAGAAPHLARHPGTVDARRAEQNHDGSPPSQGRERG